MVDCWVTWQILLLLVLFQKLGGDLVGALDKALDHLKLSISRLEASVATSSSRKSESGHRQAQIAELQAECDRLTAVTQQIDKGLEKTIDRLKFVLED